MSISTRFALALLGALWLCGGAPQADRLVTKEGRVLEPKRVREQDGSYEVHFENGTLVCSKDQIASAEIFEDLSEYVPKNEDEKQKLAQGYVRVGGKWISKGSYEAELKRRQAESAKRTEEIAKHSEFHNGWTKETQHFRFVTDTSAELLDYYANLLEAYYALMDDRIGINPTPTLRRVKMTINIYKSWDEFRDLNNGGLGGGVAGYFNPDDKTLNFFHHYPDPAMSTWVALHECTHLLTHLIDPQFLPQMGAIWCNEGVADYYGSADVTRDPKSGKFTIKPGKLQTHRTLTVQNAIKDGKDVKLVDLLHIDPGPGFTAFEYAHAWSFVYFLQSREEYRKGFIAFFKDYYARRGVNSTNMAQYFVVEHDEVQKLLERKLGVKNWDALEKEWKTFVANIPIDGPEARFERGERYVSFGEGSSADDALKDLDAAIEGGVTDPRAFAARGQLRRYKGDRAGALADLRKAVDLAPLNAGFRFELASTLTPVPMVSGNFDGMKVSVKGGKKRGFDLTQSAADIESARQSFGLASELDPENSFYRKVVAEFAKALARKAAKDAKAKAGGGESEPTDGGEPADKDPKESGG